MKTDTELKELKSILSELYNVNDHLDQIASHIKSCDPEWVNSSCDKPAIFGLMGHKEYVDQKLHELEKQINKLESNNL